MKALRSMARGLLRRYGYAVFNTNHPGTFVEDGLATHHNHAFTGDPAFLAAYARAIRANGGHDHRIQWRAHVALWAAGQASALDGDFVECGVSTGFLMSAIMQSIDWNRTGKRCYLFDTFSGLVPEYVSAGEARDGRLGYYHQLDVERVRQNFSEFDNVNLVVGPVPDTLAATPVDRVCYLSLDMNCAAPEIAAFRHFWPKLVPGAWVVLDDYAYSGYEEQHAAFNALARELGFTILCLPTGQGLVQRPVTPQGRAPAPSTDQSPAASA